MNLKNFTLVILIGFGVVAASFYSCNHENCKPDELYNGQYFKGYIFLLHSNLTSNTGIVAQIDNNYTRKAGLIYDGAGFNCDTAQIEDIVYFKVRKYKNNGPIMAFGLTYVEPTNISSETIIDTLMGNFDLTRRFNDHLGDTVKCETVGTAHTRYHYEGKVASAPTKDFMGKPYTLHNWKKGNDPIESIYSIDNAILATDWYLDVRTEISGDKRILSMSLNDNH